MKLIFLDINGVMASSQNYKYRNGQNASMRLFFDPPCVQQLNNILEKSGAEIVLTSTYRKVYNLSQQKAIFEENKLIAAPTANTIDLGYADRSKEIRTYLTGKKVEAFVILDDTLITGFPDNFVWINPLVGLHEDNFLTITKILKC